MSLNQVKVMYYNAQSICAKSKADEVFNYLVNNEIDVACFNETWLNPEVTFGHKDYKTYRLDRPSINNVSHGGVAICINKRIKHKLLPHLNLSVIEAIGISIDTNRGPLVIYSVYFPNTNYSDVVFDSFRCDIKKLTADRNSFFICGDFNSKHPHWNCRIANKPGKILFDEMNYNHYIIDHPPTPTYFSYLGNPTTIDIILTNNLNNYSQPCAHQELSSDHIPVTFEIYLVEPTTVQENLILRYDKTDWVAFKDYLNTKIQLDVYCNPENLNSKEKIDAAISLFTNLLLEAQDLAVPKEPQKVSENDLDFPVHLKDLIQLRNLKRRQWQRTRLMEIRADLVELNKLVQNEIQLLRNAKWDSHLAHISSLKNNQKLWKISKILRKKSKSIPTLRKEVDGQSYSSYVITDEGKAEHLAENFSSVFKSCPNTSDAETNSLVRDSLMDIENLKVEDFLRTKPNEVSSLISKLKSKKSPGYDLINNKILKQIPKKAKVMLTYIFNACLKNSYFPDCWKNAKVIAIHKPGKNPYSSGSYRPISLLSALGKLLEKIILKRIQNHLAVEDILPEVQFGFRSGHSTNHQLSRVTSYIKQNLENRRSTGMVLFDIEKAFDCVWHNGLLHKMKQLNFSNYLLKITLSFLMDRSFSVHVNGKQSLDKPVPAGVPQGSVISPTLYSIFTYDLPEYVNVNNVEISQFADDTAFYTSSQSPKVIIDSIETSLKKLGDYCKRWNTKLNAGKTKAIFFTRRRAERFLPHRDMLMDNESIEWVDDVKFLGLHLDKKLLYKHHIGLSIEKAQRVFKLLYSLLHRRSKLSTIQKMLIYKCIIRPVFMYGSPVWSSCAEMHLRKIQIFQNKCLKTFFNLPWRYETANLHVIADIQTVPEFMHKLNEKFKASCRLSSNRLINGLIV